MSALPHNSTVSFGSAIPDVTDFTCSRAVVSVDCTALGDEQVDNRAGMDNPTASVTYSTKAGTAFDVAAGDVDTLVVSVPIDAAITEVFSEKMLLESIDFSASPNSPQLVTLNFVSTEEEAEGT